MKLIFVFCDPVKETISLHTHIRSYHDHQGNPLLPPFDEIFSLDEMTGQVLLFFFLSIPMTNHL